MFDFTKASRPVHLPLKGIWNQKAAKNYSRGFTLLELLLVVLIFSILASIGIP
jgi:prepilin-type N-terminal cleavage/methylation domain-containing protein